MNRQLQSPCSNRSVSGPRIIPSSVRSCLSQLSSPFPISHALRGSESQRNQAVSLLPSLSSFCYEMSAGFDRESVIVGWRVAYQCLHGSVESMSVVSPELGVGSLERRVPGGLGLLDAAVVLVSHSVLILWSHPRKARCLDNRRTRSGEPSCSGCAETSSWTLVIL